jgi:hypothetical protein
VQGAERCKDSIRKSALEHVAKEIEKGVGGGARTSLVDSLDHGSGFD